MEITLEILELGTIRVFKIKCNNFVTFSLTILKHPCYNGTHQGDIRGWKVLVIPRRKQRIGDVLLATTAMEHSRFFCYMAIPIKCKRQIQLFTPIISGSWQGVRLSRRPWYWFPDGGSASFKECWKTRQSMSCLRCRTTGIDGFYVVKTEKLW